MSTVLQIPHGGEVGNGRTGAEAIVETVPVNGAPNVSNDLNLESSPFQYLYYLGGSHAGRSRRDACG